MEKLEMQKKYNSEDKLFTIKVNSQVLAKFKEKCKSEDIKHTDLLRYFIRTFIDKGCIIFNIE